MKDIAIKVKDLSKLYRLGELGVWSDTLREAITQRVKSRFRDKATEDPSKAIWALKDVSFEVKRGEIIGIIGRNGAGKTTLLKILSRVTEPTEGCAEIYGRTGSLLEVGTGFHEELNGRENIYFSGAVLGLKKKEIDRKFDEIVAFAETEKFLDTPIKRYSDGMRVRLAFAIAAHLEPEILLIDEVLAVGDMGFQKKCFGKMGETAEAGKTILLVSHNMAAVNALCTKAILLDEGRLIELGDRDTVFNRYLDIVYKLTEVELEQRIDRKGNGQMRYVRYWLENSKGDCISVLRSGEDAIICTEYVSNSRDTLKWVSVGFNISDHLGNPITDLANKVSAEIWSEISPSGVIRCHIKRLPLRPGLYTFSVSAVVNGVSADYVPNAGKFEIESGNFFKDGKVPGEGKGCILMDHEWHLAPSPPKKYS